MATRNIQIIVSVRDAATKKMKNVERQIRHTGKAAKTATLDFKDFNRTLFATTAFVGTFIKAFSSMANSISRGAELDRLETQFERVLGPSSSLLSNIKNITDVAVDRMQAMKSGIALANLGITSSTEETASIIAMAGAAARQAGLDSSEGVKRVTQFLKDGSTSQLEFLNVLKSTNPRLMAQLAILNSTAGPMGNVISTQAKLRIGMNLLRAATDGNLKGFRDLSDIVKDIQDSFGNFTRTVGKFIGTALAPLIDKFGMFFDRVSSTLEHIRKNEKEIVFLSKAMIIGTASTLGLAGALGTLRLATMALGSLGFGLPMLISSAVATGAAFLGITKNADGVVNKLKLFGGFIKGIWQLVTSLDEDTGFSKIDKDLAELLRKNGILDFTQNVARAISVVKSFAKGLMDGLNKSLQTTISLLSTLTDKFRTMFGLDAKGPWSMSWLTNAKEFGKVLGEKVIPIIGLLAGLKLGAGLLSKLPVLGKLFGGGGKGGGPKGSASDPIYTIALGGLAGGAIAGAGKLGGLFKRIPGVGRLTAALSSFALNNKVLGDILTNPKGKMFAIGEMLGRGVRRGGKFLTSSLKNAFSIGARAISTSMGPAIAAGAAGIIGYKIGSMIEPIVTKALDKNTTDTTEEGFTGNILERMFFKLDKVTGGNFGAAEFIKNQKEFNRFKNSSDEENISFHKNKMAERAFMSELTNVRTPEPSGERSQISVPVQPEGEDAQLDFLGNQLKQLQGDEQSKFAEAIKQARSSGGLGGVDITPDEWKNIFLGALEASENLKTIADKAKETESFADRTRRGMK